MDVCSEHIYDRPVGVYTLADGEGQTLHTHEVEHAIFIASGTVLVTGPSGDLLYSAPRVLYAAAGVPHAFKAVGNAVVVNVFPSTTSTKEYIV